MTRIRPAAHTYKVVRVDVVVDVQQIRPPVGPAVLDEGVEGDLPDRSGAQDGAEYEDGDGHGVGRGQPPVPVEDVHGDVEASPLLLGLQDTVCHQHATGIGREMVM